MSEDVMPWEAIRYIGSAATLIAFVVAVAAWAYAKRLEQRREVLAEATDSRRADLAALVLERYGIDTRTLSREQRYQLAREELRAAMRRFYVIAAAIIVIALCAIVVLWRTRVTD